LKLKQTFVQKTTAILLLSILIVSIMAVFYTPMATQAQTTTTIPSNLLQYDYGQANGNSSRAFSNDGPGPSSFNIAWRTHIPGVCGQPIAIGGRILVQDNAVYASAGNTTYCLDAGTGQILWQKAITGSVIKLDNNIFIEGNNAYRISDGSLVWTAPSGFSIDAPAGLVSKGTFNGLTQLNGIGYDPTLKIIFTGSLLSQILQAWSIPNPTQPPTLLWTRANQTDYLKYGPENIQCEANGIAVIATTNEYLLGINVTTGATAWVTQTKISSLVYSMSTTNGVLGYGYLDGTFYGWNITTGKLMWTYNPNTPYLNQFASAPAAAYGMFYEHNEDNSVYAINATTGALVWSASGPGVGYSNIMTIAGGKVYIMMGENQYLDPISGNPSYSEFDCFDAYNGTLIWSAPVENGAPFNAQCNAYGNLYLVPMVSTYENGTFRYTYNYVSGGINGNTGTLDEIWCISDTPQDWKMQYNDPAHTNFGNGPAKPALDWTTQLDGGMVSSPTLVNGVAYVGTITGTIHAVEASTGTEIWNYSTGVTGFSSTLAVVNGKLYTGAENGTVRCLDATKGTLIWATNAGTGMSTGSPIVTNGDVYLGTANGIVYCLDASSGSVRWTFNTTGSISVTPTIDTTSNELFIPANVGAGYVISGYLFKLNANTGAQIWNVTVPGGSISAPATIGAGMVFVRSNFLRNYALNATTGQTIWTYVIGSNGAGTPDQATGIYQNCAILYQYGRVYLTDFFGLTCLDAFNGTQLWSTFLARQDNAPGLSYSYNRIYYVNENGALYVVDSLTGQKLSYYQFSGAAQLHSIPTPYNGKLYVSTLLWQLVCLKEAAPLTIASTDISFELRPSTIVKGDTVTVAGSITNVHSAVPLSIYFSKGDSSLPINISAITDGNGGFTVKYAPDMVGDWTVVVSYAGDATHTVSNSQSQTLTVTEPTTPEPTQTPKSMADLYFVPSVIGIIVAIVVVGAVIILALRKRP
jgi:eukaryotic-like serine/threonine-protein kinase